jgi:mannose-6-phosphate isomerase-like protein (cupin superfamily)
MVMTTRQEESLYPQLVKTAYEKWLEREGLPLIDVPAGTDLLAIRDFYAWDRIGARAVFLNEPDTMRGQVGAFLLEIPPKTSTKPQHHLYDEILYILRGHGHTQVWVTADKKVSVEWQTHDLMAIPLNAWFQITNLGDQPAKILSINTAPCVINCFNNTDRKNITKPPRNGTPSEAGCMKPTSSKISITDRCLNYLPGPE